jgi:hypothetical protein
MLRALGLIAVAVVCLFLIGQAVAVLATRDDGHKRVRVTTVVEH